jgi:hypothetical protein
VEGRVTYFVSPDTVVAATVFAITTFRDPVDIDGADDRRFAVITDEALDSLGRLIDDGFLVRHQTKIRHHNMAGDWLTITGRVTGSGVDGAGRPVVTVDQEARNQYGELSALGTGTVALPTRSTPGGTPRLPG